MMKRVEIAGVSRLADGVRLFLFNFSNVITIGRCLQGRTKCGSVRSKFC
jgi:hypothetical protein